MNNYLEKGQSNFLSINLNRMSEYIIQGSYGCIIRPNINCDGTFGNVKNITKFFFDKTDYYIEKKNQLKMEKIDKNNKFINKLINSCKIILTNDIKQKIINLDLCKLESNEVYQITYEYGGIDIYHIFNHYQLNPNEISLIKVDIEGSEEYILNDLFNLYITESVSQ